MVRPPAVAGTFYEGTKDALLRQIHEAYRHPNGPGRLPTVARGGHRIKALVVPHAGYAYSGPIAAHAYEALAADGWPDRFVILGPNHRGIGAPVALCPEDHETPLGTAQYDERFGTRLVRGAIERDGTAHVDEHSIEVQLPFLLHLRPNVSFVPIAMRFQEWEVAREVGERVMREAAGTRTVVIASTDFTHAGANYGQLPPRGVSVSAFATRQDKMALDAIGALDPKALQDTVHEHNITMCGYGPATAALVAAKGMGAQRARFLAYTNSAEMSGDRGLAVGYGAFVVE